MSRSKSQPTIQEAFQRTICWRWKLCSISNGWVTIYNQKDEVQRSSWPWQHSTFISQVTWSFRPPRISLYWAHHLLIVHIFPPHQYYIMCCQTSGTHSCWSSLLHRQNQIFVHLIPSQFSNQITCIEQAIEDGFQQHPIQHSVLTLLDFRKAYVTIWRGIPSTFIGWIRSFFNDRRAHVQLFNDFSSSSHFIQGLPQSSVLAPLLFLFYINNLASSLNDDAVIALFADVASIFTTARKKEDAEVAAQSVVNSVLIWSQEWKLNLNGDKREVYLFSTWSNDSTWQPAPLFVTQKIRVNVTPCLLGVILDNSLTFNAHLRNVSVSSEPQHTLPGAGV